MRQTGHIDLLQVLAHAVKLVSHSGSQPWPDAERYGSVSMANSSAFLQLFNVYAKYIDYLVEKTRLPLGLQNIAESGRDTEVEIRGLLRRVLPQRYRITHGHVVYAPERTEPPIVSPQVDLIIVDNLIPNSIFTLDPDIGLEVVPLEATLAIVELKKTLSRKTLFNEKGGKGAIPHLRNVMEVLGFDKTNDATYWPGGLEQNSHSALKFEGLYHSNPMLAVLSLDHDLKFNAPNSRIFKVFNSGFQSIETRPPIDLILSFSGLMIAPGDMHGNTYLLSHWPKNKSEWPSYSVLPKENEADRARVVAEGIGYILGYLSKQTGRYFPVSNYFFNSVFKSHRLGVSST
jgi:hypothetical protein